MKRNVFKLIGLYLLCAAHLSSFKYLPFQIHSLYLQFFPRRRCLLSSTEELVLHTQPQLPRCSIVINIINPCPILHHQMTTSCSINAHIVPSLFLRPRVHLLVVLRAPRSTMFSNLHSSSLISRLIDHASYVSSSPAPPVCFSENSPRPALLPSAVTNTPPSHTTQKSA